MTERIAWIVGDIHGCYDELAVLQDRIEGASARAGRAPLIVSVGDLVDRGPASREVVQVFLEGAARGTHAAVAGNHEALMLRALYDMRPDLFAVADVSLPDWVEPVSAALERLPAYARMAPREDWGVYFRLLWLAQGGAETLASYGFEPRDPGTWDLPLDHLRFLATLPLLWEGPIASVTHALITRADLLALREGGPQDPGVARRALWSRSLPAEAPDPERTHVSGHSVLRRVRRYPARNLVRVDLGVYLRRKLGAWCPALDRTLTVTSGVNWKRGG
jgi:hypothetical protein